MTMIGDVCQIQGRRGTWVAAQHRRDVRDDMWQFLRADTGESLTIGEASTTLITRPVISVGMAVRYRGHAATVTAINGNGSLRIAYSDRAALTRDGQTFHARQWNVADCDRAQIVLDNISLFT